jgi:hypothetical protein
MSGTTAIDGEHGADVEGQSLEPLSIVTIQPRPPRPRPGPMAMIAAWIGRVGGCGT